MIHASLHKSPIAIDPARHRALKLDRDAMDDWARVSTLNSFFINTVEFGDVCREYPIVFVRAGEAEVAPVAVFGLLKDENLFVDQGQWRADYIPAHLRAWPFGLAPAGDDKFALCFDQSCTGFNESRGTPLFGDDGQWSPYMQEVKKYLEALQGELQRTRAACTRLQQLDLLQDMRFEAKQPDGESLTVDGFLALNEAKLAALPDATVVELHKTGLLALIHAHHISLGNMRRLFERRARQRANA